jgi:hypothetical protein
MSKWYEVKVTTITVFAVEVKDDEDEDKAMEYAMNEVSMEGDSTAECILVEGKENIDRIQRHADKTLAIEEDY